MRILSVVVLVAFVATWILATSSTHAQADLTLTKTADMNFGDVIAGGSSGTVVLTAAASPSRSLTGGAELGNPTSVSSATFTVSGEPGYTYAVTLPSTDVTITSGVNSMIVNAFTSSPSGTGTLTGGSETLYIGATLNVGAFQASGSDYTGSFNVTVAYN